MQYEVIDNFLPKEQFEAIQNMMMRNKNLTWFYEPNVVCPTQELKNTMYFVHMFYENYAPRSAFMGDIFPLIQKLDAKSLIRIKGNMFPNLNSNERIKEPFHADYDFKHKGAIYYVNTNNGPTVFEDGTEIEAVENRILLFEPHKMHTMMYCTDQKVRVNININYF
jgi:hypothetical protein